MPQADSAYEQLKRKLKMQLSDVFGNGAKGRHEAADRDTVRSHVRALVQAAQQKDRQLAIDPPTQERLIEEISNDVAGIGPLEPLMADPEVTEIMVNGPHEVYVEKHGRLERSPVQFEDSNHLMLVIERMLDRVGLTVTKSEPCLDASLPDGTRLNIIIPPLVLNGPTMTLRKRSAEWNLDALVSQASLTPQAAEFLKACIKAKVNMVVSGGTSTGKTTIVSVLSSFIPQDERIITIENVAELELPKREHWVRLVGRGANMEGRGEISLRTLVRNALRMRPDRIILGESRGGEALDVVQAMHTGHEGVITVLHGNSPQAALERLQTLMLMSGLDLPPSACQMQIASAVDVIIHMARYADGSRRVSSIAHIESSDKGGFHLQEIFTFEVKGYRPDGTLDGALRHTGVTPKFNQKFQLHNVSIPGGAA